jgi:hypothetical protein
MPYADTLRYPLTDPLVSAEPETLDFDWIWPESAKSRQTQPTRAESVTALKVLSLFGRSERIRTSDPIVPNKARRRVVLKSLLIFVAIEPNVRPLFTRSGSHPVPRGPA